MMLLKRVPLLDGLSVMDAHKGGGKGGVQQAAAQPIIAPTAPVQEASVDITDERDKKKKLMTGKSSLKLPLANTETTGIKV